MQRVRFSIIIVCLNAGPKLHQTVESILCQSFRDYEILIKDGGSTDGSLPPPQSPADTSLPEEGAGSREYRTAEDTRIRVRIQSDSGIYDAMNQAVKFAEGEYFLFLNCGDFLYDRDVLKTIAGAVDSREPNTENRGRDENALPLPAVFYGNLYQRALGTQVYSYREITPFTCYRNIPCHQTCFYHRSLFAERAYDLRYPVRADYEHFLYCYFTRKAKMVYLPVVICSYEGGGFSETKEHLKKAKLEHREITRKYLSGSQLLRYRLILLLTLQPLRTFAANNKALSGFYNKCKTAIYRK